MWRLISLFAIFATVAADELVVAERLHRENASPSDLRKAIFQNYDKKALPVTSPNQTVPIGVSFTPVYIRELDEEKEILVMDAWIIISWVDKHLTWDPSSYSDMKTLIVPSEDIWKPDLSAYTASPDIKLLPNVYPNAILNYTGVVFWVPPLTVNSRCPLDLHSFPHDVQRCLVKFGSWTFGSKSIDLLLYTPTVDTSFFQDNNPEWSFQGITVKKEDKFYPCCPDESYASLNYNITLKRRPSSTICVSNTVSAVAVLLALLMFFLPSDSAQKFVLGALAEVLLGLVAMYLSIVIQAPAAKLQASERVYPYMIVVAVFLLFEVITVNMARTTGSCRPPKCLLTACRLFCQPFGACASSNAYDDIEGEKAKNSASVQDDWKVVATALDRVLLFAALGVSILFFKFV